MLTHNARIVRRHGLEQDLRRYEERARDMQRRRESARSALHKARADYKLATIRVEDAEDECDSIRQLLAFDPDVVNGLPCELLQAIFVYAFAGTDWKSIETATYDLARSLVPYQLGAVCRHWRCVVRDTPELWTYIATPPWRSSHRSNFPSYAERQLAMSRSRPLQLCLVHDDQRVTGPDAHWLFDTLMTLAKHIRRWGRVKLAFPRAQHARILAMLFDEAPLLLEELFIGRSQLQPGRDLPPIPLTAAWPSGASNLRLLYTDNITLRLTSTLPRLQSARLQISNQACFDAVTDALHKLPCLKRLLLHFYWIPDATSESLFAPMSFPALESLTIRGTDVGVESMVTRLIIAPRLRALSTGMPLQTQVESWGLDRLAPSWGQSYVAAFPAITNLELIGDGRPQAAQGATFARLSRLRRLVFSECSFPERSTTSGKSDSFWSQLAVGEPLTPVWPDLEYIEISSCSMGASWHRLDALRGFVEVRSPADPIVGQRLRLSLQSIPSQSISPDFVTALTETLGTDNFHIDSYESMY